MNMKIDQRKIIATIVGARPQFIKAAMLSRVLRNSYHEILIHTGQHYDYNMSDVFFEELSIPRPDYNLGISGGNHGKMTGEMLIALEDVFLSTKPDIVLVYGDTNSTLAGALAAVKLNIPVVHVEAGVRMNTLANPEEVNRILTDRISSLLLCCTQSSVDALASEGVTKNVFLTGDLMYDAALFHGNQQNLVELLTLDGKLQNLPDAYYLLTCHRQENTGSDTPLFEIFTAMNQLDAPTIYPVHPRNEVRAKHLLQQQNFNQIQLVKPVGYIAALQLIKNAKKIVTDSGGLQREAWFMDKQCVTILDHVVWPETMGGNANQLCTPNAMSILSKLSVTPNFTNKGTPFGDGHAAEKIVEAIRSVI